MSTEKIALIGPIPPPHGGIASYVKQLAKEIAEIGFKVEVIDISGVEKRLDHKNIKLVVTKGWIELLRAMIKSNARIFNVHAWTYNVDPFLLTTAITAVLRRKKFVITILGGAFIPFMVKSPWYRKVPKIMSLILADKIITGYQPHFKKALEILPSKHREKVCFIPTFVDITLFNPGVKGSEVKKKFGIRPDQSAVLFGPHLEPIYAPDHFIRAASIIAKKHHDVVFMLVGDGSLEKHLRLLVKELSIEKNVIFAGFVPMTEMPKYYAACDIYCNPCIFGQGMSTFEALACAKPAVGYRQTQIKIRDAVDGFLVRPGKIEELADKVMWLLEHPKARREMGINGRIYVAEHLNIKARVQEIIQIYNKLLCQRA